MSYAIVETEIDNLTRSLLEIRAKIETDESLQSVVYSFDNLLNAIQDGMERHIEECSGVVAAIHEARDKMTRGLDI